MVPGVAGQPLLVVPGSDDTLCHIAGDHHDMTLCGMYDPAQHPLHDGAYEEGRCTGCGKIACKTCEIMEWI